MNNFLELLPYALFLDFLILVPEVLFNPDAEVGLANALNQPIFMVVFSFNRQVSRVSKNIHVQTVGNQHSGVMTKVTVEFVFLNCHPENFLADLAYAGNIQ